MHTVLILEDGATFHGEPFGAKGTAVGEVVFNTGMTGYQEILTDPSYKGQMVTMTYPHIGNYGINPADVESSAPQVEALIVRELCQFPSNHRSIESLDEYLKRNHVLGIHQIDTRALTRHIREKGSMMGILSSDGKDENGLKAQLRYHPRIEGRDLVQYVTQSESVQWKDKVSKHWYSDRIQPLGKKRFKIAAYDFGIKRNILRLMTSYGFKITVVPASLPPEEVLSLEPHGIFLSNGPGDPEGVRYAIETVKKLAGRLPIFGICLGHQILGLALGAKTYKLKFGHHGSNHPVKELSSGVIEITAQNHNYAIDPATLDKAGFILTHRNLNDGTVEGMRHKTLPVFSVQYHPEASPGPHDSLYLFRQFYEFIDRHS